MSPTSDPYEDAARAYIRLVSNESQEVATVVEQIQATAGAHAALRAVLILVIMKMEVQENHWIPGFNPYIYLFNDYPEVMPLMKRAMACCLEHWGVSIAEISTSNGGIS